LIILYQEIFNVDKLKLFYKIKGTDFKAENDWRFRIIIPVIMNGKIHCFTGRDYTGKNPLKYYSSSKQNSVTPIDECFIWN
jgi:hypothetical protein